MKQLHIELRIHITSVKFDFFFFSRSALLLSLGLNVDLRFVCARHTSGMHPSVQPSTKETQFV